MKEIIAGCFWAAPKSSTVALLAKKIDKYFQ